MRRSHLMSPALTHSIPGVGDDFVPLRVGQVASDEVLEEAFIGLIKVRSGFARQAAQLVSSPERQDVGGMRREDQACGERPLALQHEF